MYSLSAPGKIFLAGEYGVLKGGAVVILNTEPRFELQISRGSAEISGIPIGSPAEKMLGSQKKNWQDWDLKFVDPYSGRGGFGASSAQFLLVYFWLTESAAIQTGLLPQFNVRDLLKAYHKYSWDGQGMPPSGADVVSQYLGGICFWSPLNGNLERLPWQFQDLEFLALPTGFKLATHEHLKDLKDFNSEQLKNIMLQIEKSMRLGDSQLFLKSMQDWSDILEKNNWVHERTLNLLKEILQDSRVRIAKGCGAMGADVVLLLMDRDDMASVAKDLVKKYQQQPITRQHLTEGIQWASR